MGARHVAAAFAQWGSLPDRPFRLLAYMALVAKDATVEPAYWGGRDGLCLGLGIEPTPNGHRIARRAIRDLVEAGAIERRYVGHSTKRSEYRLILTATKGDGSVPLCGTHSTSDDETEGGHESPPKGGHLSPKRGTQAVEKGDTTVPPRKKRNTRSEEEEEISSVQVSTDRACEPTTDEIDLLSAKRILKDEFEDLGRALTRQSPAGVTGDDAIIWAAMQVLARREAS